jgi:hypothetical protein
MQRDIEEVADFSFMTKDNPFHGPCGDSSTFLGSTFGTDELFRTPSRRNLFAHADGSNGDGMPVIQTGGKPDG